MVAHLLHGPHYLQVAIELWQLADREDRVKAIWTLLDRAYERELLDLNTVEIGELDALLEGLDASLQRSLLDENWQVPEERMEEVRARAKLLDLGDRQSHEGRDGVSEGLSQVHGLRTFLKRGIEQGLHLIDPAFDRENRDLNIDEVVELDRLLDGLEDALKETVLDVRGRVPPDKLPELRVRAKLLDLEEREQHRADEGVSEASSQVYGLRAFLKQAIDRGLHVARD